MKKIKIILLATVIIASLGTSFLIGLNTDKDSLLNEEVNLPKPKHSSFVSMMLETGAGTGQYTLTTSESWPTTGYKFNKNLSRCENGGKLKWDDEENTILMIGDVSDKCYVYFDVHSNVLLTDYVKSKYTGTQGENGLYLHNSNLANGASDNSYRYAGGDYQLTTKATTEGYTVIRNVSAFAKELLNFYCDGKKISSFGTNCANNVEQYYVLAYDTATKIETLYEALTKAVQDGYLESGNIKNYVCFGQSSGDCELDKFCYLRFLII